MADVKVKLREAIDKTFSISAGQKHNFKFILPQVFVLDVEDGHFNHNRSILLPDLTSVDKSTPVLDARRVTGLGVLFAALVHAKKNPAQGLFVTGHTDASGGAAYNQTLSEERAKNVSLLLRGKRDDWRKQAAKDDAVDDYQTILKWQSMRAGWETDPGPINNKLGVQTKKAIGEFQRRYTEEVANAKAGSPFFGKTALVKPGQEADQIVGKDTWGAFYDIYAEDLMDLLELTDIAQLEAMQAAFKPPPGMTDFVGCGEHIPHNPVRRDPFAKQSDELDGPQKNPPDRRVEILFFDPGEEVDLVCHPKPGKCIPAECPIYTKGPHQQVPIGIPKGLNVAEVNLKLTFVDPEGKVRPFPAGLEVEAKFGDPVNETTFEDDGVLEDDDEADAADGGDSASADAAAPPDPGADPDAESMEVDQEPNEKTQAGGLLRFVIPRKASKLFLRILAGDKQRFITADPKNLDDQQLATLSEATEAVGKGRVYFQLPTVFNTRQGYFKGPDGIEFKDGQFLNIDNRQTQIGSRESPAELRLEIHWQHFKFEYFDRFTSSPTTVPQPRSKDAGGKDIPGLELQGFKKIADPPSSPLFALARASWDLKVGKDTVHCLAWVRRDLPDGNPARELPDDKCLTLFRATNTFVRTEGDGKSPDSPRTFVTLTPGAKELTTPGVDRLRLYDLPDDWWSANYPARLGGDDIDKIKPFEQLAATKSAPDKPYVVSLDTIVLDDVLDANNKTPKLDDTAIGNRFAIYDNQLNVHNPDTASGETYFTREATLKKKPTSPVLHDFPGFTRLITRGVAVYDIFKERTPRDAKLKGFPIGARMAKRFAQKGTDISTTQHHIGEAPYSSIRPNGTSTKFPFVTSFKAGIAGVLRCCGHTDAKTERFMVFQYMSTSFNFAATPTGPNETQLKNPPTGTKADNESRDCLLNVAKRWNGTPLDFKVGTPETARGRWKFLLVRGTPSANAKPDPGEVRINIFGSRRASQGGDVGNWAKADMLVRGGGGFTAAHEMGHALTEPDEYLNTDDEPSGQVTNIGEAFRSPGTPYGLDANGQMGGGELTIRARNFWHLVLWMRDRGYFTDAADITLEHGPNKFSAALTARSKSREQFPVASLQNIEAPLALGKGFCDQFVYVAGSDGWTAGELEGSSVATPFDGFVMVRVKMAWTFDGTTDYDDMFQMLIDARATIDNTFNKDKHLVVRSVFEGKPVRLRVLFAPRFLLRTFPTKGDGRARYFQSIDNPVLATPINAASYAARVNLSINPPNNSAASTNSLHAEIRVTSGGGTPGVTDGAGNSPRRGTVREDGFLSSRFKDDVALVFAQLVGLPDASLKNANDFKPLTDHLLPTLPALKLSFE